MVEFHTEKHAPVLSQLVAERCAASLTLPSPLKRGGGERPGRGGCHRRGRAMQASVWLRFSGRCCSWTSLYVGPSSGKRARKRGSRAGPTVGSDTGRYLLLRSHRPRPDRVAAFLESWNYQS